MFFKEALVVCERRVFNIAGRLYFVLFRPLGYLEFTALIFFRVAETRHVPRTERLDGNNKFSRKRRGTMGCRRIASDNWRQRCEL